MAKIYSGLKHLLSRATLALPLDDQSISGVKVDIFNFPEYIMGYRLDTEIKDNVPKDLRDPGLDNFQPTQIKNIQWALLKNQIEFSYNTTPAIFYLWSHIEPEPAVPAREQS